MEKNEGNSLVRRILKLYLKEQKPFTRKRDINWKALKVSALFGVVSLVLILLLLPTTQSERGDFSQKIDRNGNKVQTISEENATADTWTQMQQSQQNSGIAPHSLDYIGSSSRGSSLDSKERPNRGSSMILERAGVTSKTQLSPGSKIKVKLLDSISLSTDSVPVIASVLVDVEQDGALAIPRGSKVIGDLLLDETTERASVTFRSLQMPDGRERQISAIAQGSDGQLGIEGKISSLAVRNVAGKTLSQFIGAYADGSIQRGQMGSSEGGHENGLKTAVSETAKDLADDWAENLKKEKKWLEIKAGKEFIMTLTQPFQFKDPGSTYGN